MNLSVNNEIVTLEEGSTLSDLIISQQPQQPFAVAVNTIFIPKSAYTSTQLKENDLIDIVRPVAGG